MSFVWRKMSINTCTMFSVSLESVRTVYHKIISSKPIILHRAYNHSLLLTNLATSFFSTGFPSRGPSIANSFFITVPALTVSPVPFICPNTCVIALLISSSPIVSTPDAYSSKTSTCASSFCERSSRCAALNSAAAARLAAARLRKRERSWISVLTGLEVLAALVVSARMERRTLRLEF